MDINIEDYYCHGLGGYDDKDNGKTSFYFTRSWNYDESKDYEINHQLKMEIVSLARLKNILRIGKLLSPISYAKMGVEPNEKMDKQLYPIPRSGEKYLLAATHGPRLNNNNEICLLRLKDEHRSYGEKASFHFLEYSIAIMINPIIETKLADKFANNNDIYINNMKNGDEAMIGESRARDEISIEYFAGILLPISLIPDFKNIYKNIDNLDMYIKYRIEEIEYIVDMLNTYNIDLPIYDTNTGEQINTKDKVLKIINRNS